MFLNISLVSIAWFIVFEMGIAATSIAMFLAAARLLLNKIDFKRSNND